MRPTPNVCTAILLLLGVCSSMGFGQAKPEESVAIQVEMGLGGYWKVGYPTRMKVRLESPVAVSGGLRISTTDGDGVPVVYNSEAWKVDLKPQESIEVEAFVQHGRSSQPILVDMIDDQGSVIASHALTREERGTVLPATQPWIVSLGGDLQLEQSILRSVDGTLPNFTYSSIADCHNLPSHATGYSGVDQIGISTLDDRGWKKIAPSQASAIRDWVQSGGKLLVSVGTNAATVSELPWLHEMLPARIRERLENIDPGPLESWTNSDKPLAKLTCARIEACSLVDLNAYSTRRETFPLIAKRAWGIGQVLFVGTDLDSPALLEWSDRGKFLDKLCLGVWKAKGSDMLSKEVASSIGYDDLSGQLRATLDVFPNVHAANLTFLAVILCLFLLLVGPFDYFVVARAWKRPTWTWATLWVASLAFTVGISALAISWKPKILQRNQLTLWDFDWEGKSIHGRTWMHLYSGNQDRLQVSVNTKAVGSLSSEGQPIELDWLGLPGNGLGGFDSAVASDRGMPRYEVELSPIANRKANWSSLVRDVGIPQAGTKSFQGSWSSDWQTAPELSPLHLVSGSDMLEGKWSNPLGVDILDGVILYRNWMYALPTRFQPGQIMELSITSQPKDLARRLQRRRIIEGSERSVPWNPLDREDLERLTEMLLFYKVAGGESYTSLNHRYFRSLDLSDLLRMDRAIVVGRIKESTLDVHAQVGSEEHPIELNEEQTWIRVLLPVVTR